MYESFAQFYYCVSSMKINPTHFDDFDDFILHILNRPKQYIGRFFGAICLHLKDPIPLILVIGSTRDIRPTRDIVNSR